ncbi:2'-5'-oligoadenylate synthase 1-like [Neopelma chrysocephalum]|uniref:2'-5'-oligoadenylate synthase 1-like n=1 Tax=Neopelma chrysocephalum TaxID=114329 RepID=UPI000FCD1624|nr:2'-5'-oligoadenylate synthase 1-like [Neopelma chrysocephalum]
MNVGQGSFMNELRTVSAKNLDGWIAQNLEPSTAFSMQVKQTVRQICDFLKEDCFGTEIHVNKTVKGGSAGKGTALKNNSDADVVLFLSCLSSYQKQKEERKDMLDLIRIRLNACRENLQFSVYISEPRYKGPDNTPRSLSLTLSSKENGESTDVDILPAYDALGQVMEDAPPRAEVYVGLLNACSHPGEFSPCFTELQKKFVKRLPAKSKNLLRLVKHWYKELKLKNPKADLPPKYALELLTIYAWEEGTGSCDSFVMAQGFLTVLKLLCRYQDICVYWEKYYSLQHREIGDYVKRLLSSDRPVILDPADPTGILGQGKNWALMARAAASSCSSLPCLADIQPWEVQPARRVNIEVRQLSGTRLSLTISPYDTIRKVKEEIQQEWGVPFYRQNLAQQEPGRSNINLQDSKTLAAYGIFYSTTLVLLQTEPQEMQIFVKDDKNRTTTYTVLPTDTVRKLKEQIQSRQGPSADQQRLTYGSRELEDRHTLAHYNVQPQTTIYLLLRLRGGEGPQHPQFPACSPS